MIRAEALAWLASTPAPTGAGVVTSLPDLSEVPLDTVEAYEAWLVSAARAVVSWVGDDGAAVFYQSDVRRGPTWIDKGALVSRGAREAGGQLAWHGIVLRRPPGTIAHGRATYSHLLAFSRSPTRTLPARPDVLPDAGPSTWSKGMGALACRAAIEMLRDHGPLRVVVDPFCGGGAVLAVANAMGFDALGVDLSQRRCVLARRCKLAP